uniref:EGF-like domain-containing protein n=1 Tax=Panagrellus redivivus TaxID=6233 RepID=A0A7E4VAZ5_PANRE
MKSLLIIFTCIKAIYATQHSILPHIDTSTITIPKNLKNDNCPLLFYGPNCEIPYCFPENGELAQHKHTYYCSCNHSFLKGDHCEVINCNGGDLVNSTLKCECPVDTFGAYCQWTVSKAVLIGFEYFVSVFIFGGLVFLNHAYWKVDASKPEKDSNNKPIVEHVVFMDRGEGPPTYGVAVYATQPPKYTV